MTRMLNESLDIVGDGLKKYRSIYEQNEMAVRDQIVNPILRGLGWNPEDPEEVQPNISTEEGVPDYSLIKNGKKVLFIEAKKLSVDIKQREVIRQLAKYCFG
ncbi:MAG: restriction endonuclease, partial [Nitrososphaerales archaeon]